MTEEYRKYMRGRTRSGSNAGKTGVLLDAGTGMEELERFFLAGPVLVLTGAGISTESGIPDYRGPNGVLKNRLPMKYQEFVGSLEARRRYWAGSAAGWERMHGARPNSAHRALAALEEAGLLAGIITQNVDRLHRKAGSSAVIELHGALAETVCLDCGGIESRDRLQDRLRTLNPAWETLEFRLTPDGDADIPTEALERFTVPTCLNCGGMLKPNVVFFGEDVPRDRVERAWRMFDAAGALFVAGSSLTVYSGFRFADRAAREGKPVAILNQGATRADTFAAFRVDARAGAVLPALAERLTNSTVDSFQPPVPDSAGNP